MLLNLKISNFILVKELNLYFLKGLQVLTGETGAGKSIIIGAINIVLGSTIKGDLFYNKEKKIRLEATFDIDLKNTDLINLIDHYDIDHSEEILFISREVHPDGKSLSFLNGRRVTNQIIKEFRECLFDFHSQRDQQLLLNEEFKLLVLDRYGELLDIRENFKKTYNLYKNMKLQLSQEIEAETKDFERVQLYEYQIKELEEARLTFDEEDLLDGEYKIFSNAQDILDGVSDMKQKFYEQDNSLYDSVSVVINRFETYEKDSELILELLDHLRTILYHFDEIVSFSRQIPDKIYLDENRLNEIEERLRLYHRLKSKYKMSIPEIIKFYQKMEEFVNQYKQKKSSIKKIEIELTKLRKEVTEIANELSSKRKEIALQLSAKIANNLRELSIMDANFEIKIDKKYENQNNLDSGLGNYDDSGQDKIEFLFSANKGSVMQPIKISASGGELSRILLVIKKILSDKYPPQTIIFDEIDSGIGGKTADMLGSYIAKISQNHQVLCITHLAQIAGYADLHLKIIKNSLEDSTEINVEVLKQSDRIKEIARMLSGKESESALKHAEELINKRGE